MSCRTRFSSGTVVLLASASVFSLAVPLQARRRPTEQQLLARIQRESDPIKKAKDEVTLGRLQLDEAAAAYRQSQFAQGAALLDSCLNRMQSAWTLLEGTGRDASRKPQGFKQLDIALRESARLLKDLLRSVPYPERAPVDRVARELNRIHQKDLAALFPGAHPPPPPAKPDPGDPLRS